MKTTITFAAFVFLAVIMATAAPKAYALSCLPVDMYLKDIVGKEDEVVVFVGTVTDQIEEADYTAEILTVSEVKQGYAESEMFAYHQKHPDWNYLCNAGPGKKGDKSVYIAGRDTAGKYNVYQRLALTDPLVKTLNADLKEAEVEGQLSETTKIDRMNQIMTTINDLIAEIKLLFKEYVYWKNK